MKQAYIIQVQMVTPDKTVLICRNRHDYQTHIDAVTGEFYMLDASDYYYRQSVNEVPAKITVIDTNSPFEEQRKVQFWRSFGKNAEHYPEGIYLSLEQMETEHIRAILETQHQIKGQPVEQMFLNELNWRKTYDLH